MKKILFIALLLTVTLSACAPTEVENAVDQANLECPLNFHVGQLESIELDDENIVCSITCNQMLRNVILQFPDRAKMMILQALNMGGGQDFKSLIEVAKEYNCNIIIRVEDEDESFDPVDLTVTPEELNDINDGGLQLDLF